MISLVWAAIRKLIPLPSGGWFDVLTWSEAQILYEVNDFSFNYEVLIIFLLVFRYYYDGDLIHKVSGKRFEYQFVCDLKLLLGYSAGELSRLVSGASNVSLQDALWRTLCERLLMKDSSCCVRNVFFHHYLPHFVGAMIYMDFWMFGYAWSKFIQLWIRTWYGLQCQSWKCGRFWQGEGEFPQFNSK